MTYEVPDDYRLQKVERTGYPDGCPPNTYFCPHCGMEVYGNDEVFYRDGEIIGCYDCILSRKARDVFE